MRGDFARVRQHILDAQRRMELGSPAGARSELSEAVSLLEWIAARAPASQSTPPRLAPREEVADGD